MRLIGISGKAQSGKDTASKILNIILSYGLDGRDLIKGEMTNERIKRLTQNPVSFSTSFTSWKTVSFATPLKKFTAQLFGVDVKNFENIDFKNSYPNKLWNIYELKIEDQDKRWIFGSWYEARAFRNYLFEEKKIKKAIKIVEKELTNREHLIAIAENLRKFYNPHIFINALKRTYDPKFSKWIISDLRLPEEANALRTWTKEAYLIRVNSDKQNHSSLDKTETALDNYKHFSCHIDNNKDLRYLAEQLVNFCKDVKFIP